MVHIKITKGLDIPIKGKPEGRVEPLILSGEVSSVGTPKFLACDFQPFEESKIRLIAKTGDSVKIGQPIAEDKLAPGRMWVSPAAGVVTEIRRGLKRVLQTIVIEVAASETHEELPRLSLQNLSRKELTEALKQAGFFTRIRSRPFNLLADPEKPPKNIFVKALESAPFTPPAEMHVAGHEKAFQMGLDALAFLTDGKVHLVYYQGSTLKAFSEAKNVLKHTAEGPHPISNPSLHIQRIAPIRSLQDITWTLDARDVVAIGHFLTEGKILTDRIISIAGPGILPGRTGFFKVRDGYPISTLISGRIPKGALRFISGDPLNGCRVANEDYLGFYDTAFCVIPENTHRDFLHFMGLGADKYSFSRAYLSGHFDNSDRLYDFTTSQHGEHRAFIDSSLYDKVMPLDIPTMPFVKALLAEDFDLAEVLGILEVSPEDFALPTFVCPSKMEMRDIVKKSLVRYAKEVFH